MLFNLLIMTSIFQRTFHHLLSACILGGVHYRSQTCPVFSPWRIPLHSQQATWREVLLELRPQERLLHWPPCPPQQHPCWPTACPHSSVDFLDLPTWQKGGTTASKVSSTAPTRRSGALWMYSSSNIHSHSSPSKSRWQLLSYDFNMTVTPFFLIFKNFRKFDLYFV